MGCKPPAEANNYDDLAAPKAPKDDKPRDFLYDLLNDPRSQKLPFMKKLLVDIAELE